MPESYISFNIKIFVRYIVLSILVYKPQTKLDITHISSMYTGRDV